SAYTIYKQLIETDPPPPSSLNSELPPWLDQLCLDTMTRNSRQRPTMHEVLVQLQEGAPKSQLAKTLLFAISVLAIIVCCTAGIQFVRKDTTAPTRPQLILSKKFPVTPNDDKTILYTKNPSVVLVFQSDEENPGHLIARNERDSNKPTEGDYKKNGLYRLKMPLFLGKNSLQVSVIDASGNPSQPCSLTVFRSSLSPRITTLKLPEKLHYRNNNTLRFRVTGRLNQSGCQISWNGVSAEMSGQDFVQELEFKDKNTSRLILTLKDPYGDLSYQPLPIAIVGQDPQGPRTHKSISNAVNDAIDGSRIFILPGKYINNLKINKSLDIIAVGKNTEISSMRGVTLEIFGDNSVRIRDLQLSSPEASRENLITQNSGHLTLEGCTLKSGRLATIRCGLDFKGGEGIKTSLTLKSCVVLRGSYYGIVAQSALLIVDNCEFRDSRMHGLPENVSNVADDRSVYSKQASLMIGPGATLRLSESKFKIVKDRHISITGGYAELNSSTFAKSYQEAISFGWQSSGIVKDVICSNNTQESLVGINCKTLTIEDSKFENGSIGYIDSEVGDKALSQFPALDFATAGKITIMNCVVINNNGWGLHIREESSAVTVILEGCKIFNNRRTGILQRSGQLILRKTMVANNKGHGLHVSAAQAFCQDSEFRKNALDGIHAADKGEIKLQRVTSLDNIQDQASQDESSSIKVLPQ
ncbi:MAG: right-handed parallel beta-helix repeat-containing protein, partial [Planctomycetota bacterium]|nr:right-handed parallel beta-helix repeat-containing protein [Planctomycetota bacterium]